MNTRPVGEARIRAEGAGDNFAKRLRPEPDISPGSNLPSLPKTVRMTMKSVDLNSPPGGAVTQSLLLAVHSHAGEHGCAEDQGRATDCSLDVSVVPLFHTH